MSFEVDGVTEMAPWFLGRQTDEQVANHDAELARNGMPGNFHIVELDNGVELKLKNSNGEIMAFAIDCLPGNCRFKTGGESADTLAALVERHADSAIEPLDVALLPEAEFQSVFGGALTGRTISRRGKTLSITKHGEAFLAETAKTTQTTEAPVQALDRQGNAIDLSHLGTFDPNFREKSVPVDPLAQHAGWCMIDQPREVVREVASTLLSNGPAGAFIIRKKAGSDSEALALTIKEATDSLLTFLVTWDGRRFSIKGTSGEEFKSLSALVTFYSEACRESLGLLLRDASRPLKEATAQARAAFDAAEALALEKAEYDPSRAEANASSELPAWLRVDRDIKKEVRPSMRKRAEQLASGAADTTQDTPIPRRRSSIMAPALRTQRSESKITAEFEMGSGDADAAAVYALGHTGDSTANDMLDLDAVDKAYDLCTAEVDAADVEALRRASVEHAAACEYDLGDEEN